MKPIRNESLTSKLCNDSQSAVFRAAVREWARKTRGLFWAETQDYEKGKTDESFWLFPS